MEDLKTKASHLKDHVSEYVQAYVDLGKAKVAKTASNAAAGAAIGIALFILTLFFLIFGFTALAWWLAAVFQSVALGFAAVTGLFLFLIILILVLKKKVIVPFIRNSIISKVYDEKAN